MGVKAMSNRCQFFLLTAFVLYQIVHIMAQPAPQPIHRDAVVERWIENLTRCF